MKKVTINASVILPGHKIDGINRTTHELIAAFDKLDLPFELSLFTQKLRGERLIEFPHFRKCHLPLPRWKSISRLINTLPIVEFMCHYDLYHIPHNYNPVFNPSKTILTIHDALFFAYPETHLGTDELTKLLPPLAEQCRGIITCSEHSKRDIAHYMNVDPDKIFVVPWGIDHNTFSPANNPELVKDNISSKLGINRPYFFSVSCDLGRKNTPLLVQEFFDFAVHNTKYDLVLVWRNPPAEVLLKIQSSPFSDRIHIINGIDDSTLCDLYRASTAMVFPSLYEGFGLPVLEAMACGTAVITTIFSSLPEVGGDAAHYIDPNISGSITKALHLFANDEIDRSNMIQMGLEHTAKFTWERTALETIDVYLKLLEEA